MKKFAIKNSKNKLLACNLYSVFADKRLVIFNHGFNEDKTMQGSAVEFAKSLNAAGISVLTYDFSGFGQSDEEIVSRVTALNDLKDVIQWVDTNLHSENIGLFGHSFGTSILFEAYSEKISAIAAIGAVTGPMPFSFNKIFLPEQFKEFESKGFAKDFRTYGTRQEILIDKIIIDEFNNIDQSTLLSRIKCPVLLIHGDAETEEFSLYELSRKGMQFLPQNSQIYCLHGADHNFKLFTKEVSQLITNWFMEWL